MINVEMELRQAAAVRHALFLHTKEDSVEFPSARVALLRDAIRIFDEVIERGLEKTEDETIQELEKEAAPDYGVGK